MRTREYGDPAEAQRAANDVRVLVFHPALPPYRVDLFNALAARVRLRIVLLRKNLLSQRFDQQSLRRELRADWRELTLGFTIGTRTFRFGLAREIRAFRPDVVVTDEFSPPTLALMLHRAAARARYAHVVWTDDNPVSARQDGRIRHLLRRTVVPRVDGVVVVSAETAAFYGEEYGARRAAVCPILHEDTVFRARLARAGPAARDVATAHGLFGRRVVLFVGRLALEKRVDRLLEAFAAIRDPDAVLAIVGDGPLRASLQGLAEALGVSGRTVFAGRKEGTALDAWWRLGSLLVLPSEFERFGAVVNEALLSGMPVVCSDRAGARALVSAPAGGVVVDAGDAAALTGALREWCARVPPVTAGQLDGLRASLLTTSFAAGVDAFVGLVEKFRAKAEGP